METGEQAAFRRALGEALRALREARALGLEEAASAAGVSPTRLRSVEEGKRDAWFTEVIALARLYGVDPDTSLLPDVVAAASERGSRGRRDKGPTDAKTTAKRRTD